MVRQQNRVNIATNCSKKYFRTAIEIPFIDDFKRQLKQCFTNHKKIKRFFIKRKLKAFF